MKSPLDLMAVALLLWKSRRTTTMIERLHGECRRRVKTQGSLPTADAAELLLCGLMISGQIRKRRSEGGHELGQLDELLATTPEPHQAA
ncbi:MAG: hypothetical protein ACE5MM_10055 [Nitrospiraceae bacterium]